MGYSPWDLKESDTTEQLTSVNVAFQHGLTLTLLPLPILCLTSFLSSSLPHSIYAYSSVTIDITCCSYGLLSVSNCLNIGSDRLSLIRSLIHPNHLRCCFGHEHSLITSPLTTATSSAALSPQPFPSIKLVQGVMYCSDSEVHLKPSSTNQIQESMFVSLGFLI